MGDQSSASGAPSTPGLSQVQESVSTANQTLSLVQGVDQLFGNPISHAVQTRRRKAEKRAFLGEWHDFLYDSRADMYYTPVLEKSRFWHYLTQTRGYLRPEGKCAATAGWAKLLYSLGITPKKSMVSRRLKTSSVFENHSTAVHLEVDGEVICHIINLYGKPESNRTVTVEGLKRDVEWTTILGVFALVRVGRGHGATWKVAYRPASDRSLEAVKVPFSGCLGGWTQLDADRILPMYELALDLGTSDATMAWPDKASRLKVRTEALFQNLSRLMLNRQGRVPGARNTLLITASWLAEPDRILRRLTSNGGTDNSFLYDVLRLVDAYAGPEDKKAELKRRVHWVFCAEQTEVGSPLSAMGPMSPGPDREETDPDSYSFAFEFFEHHEDPSPNFQDTEWEYVLSSMIREVLKGYGQSQVGPWKKTLHDNAEAVSEYILWCDPLSGGRRAHVDSHHVCLLVRDRSSRLWSMPWLRLEQAPDTVGHGTHEMSSWGLPADGFNYISQQ
ncbi:hypothetical protein NKR19_g3156 [Coniochaeta hoffmannii]|uniref:Uncharacterized protein n=1 Tax=Coniochaeta hoffmannii TaxID=91930 RepID=A0AA38RV10_9PEZI|nr:hypothetical protein NKR19_g3156 [Coniochaeta hoffmannii]